MHPPTHGQRGFTLVELLVVLVIAGVLMSVGVAMIGSRTTDTVRGVMDDLEGTIASAHKTATASGQDVMLATQGEWSATNPLILAFGNSTLGASTLITNGQTSSSSFKVRIVNAGLAREHMNAEIVTGTKAADWTTAGTGNADLTQVPPFNDATTGFQGILGTATNNLFQGGTTPNSVLISGTNLRATTTFWIEVVGLRGGQPYAGGPMGLLVVLANGATVYKFYNPGIKSGSNGKWRRV